MKLNKLIERKQEARFLGVIVDESLNWSKHVKTIQCKMSRYVGIMYKLKNYCHYELDYKYITVLNNHILITVL